MRDPNSTYPHDFMENTQDLTDNTQDIKEDKNEDKSTPEHTTTAAQEKIESRPNPSPPHSNQPLEYYSPTKETPAPNASNATSRERPVVPATQDHAPIIPGKSRQVKALAMKAISAQKRAAFTNICCIILCPLLMVAFASILGRVILDLIQRSSPIKEFLYCSNVPAMNDTLNIPYLNASAPEIPTTDGAGIAAATLNNVSHVNFNLLRVFGTRGPPGAASFGFQQPCVHWFGENYPNTFLYEREVNSSVSLWQLRDSVFGAGPFNGWFASLAVPGSDPTNNIFFSTKQMRGYYLYGNDPNVVSDSLLGGRLSSDQLSLQSFFTAAALNPNQPAFVSPVLNSTTGVLGTIPTRYWLNYSLAGGFSINGFQEIPIFSRISANPDDLDSQITENINSALAQIALVDKNILRSPNANRTQTAAFLLSLEKYLAGLPYGGVFFSNIAHSAKTYNWTFNIGKDRRLVSSTNFPPPGIRQLYLQTALDNAVLRNGNVSSFGNATITQGFRSMPQLRSTKIDIAFDGLIGGILFPLGISFLLPIFVVTLVKEKEERIAVMMKMNGLRTSVYYFSHFVTFFILTAISFIVFAVAGARFNLSLFTKTSPAVIVATLFLWALAQISLAFFFGALFNRSRIANIAVILLVLCSVIIALGIDGLYPDDPLSVAYFLWPPFAFYRILGILNRSSFDPILRPYKASDLVPGQEAANALLFLLFDSIIYALLAVYLNLVLPKEFGTRKPWHFPVTDVIKYFKRRKRIKADGHDKKSESYQAINIVIDETELKMEDQDVKDERERVSNQEYDPSCPLVMKNMRKIYPGRGGLGPKLAVKDITVAVESDLIFGLLGPNGAGKTTLISILVGLYEKSSGEARLAGFDIKTQSELVYRKIGVCPQFDILWDDLTVEEHLYFYARLKGISAADELAAVNKSLETVSLSDLRKRLSPALSGGEKRRLSIAIALVGNPSVVFLDEPTTGLDPEVRRLIWNIISDSKDGKSIVLTTHSMEEAEALCGRIGIMAKGTLRCLANPIRLKQLYGSGFKLFFNSLEESTHRASEFVESLLPEGWTKVDSFATNVSYEFPAVDGTIGPLFDKIESGKTLHGILDWGLGQTTLEEVFIHLIGQSDAEAAY